MNAENNLDRVSMISSALDEKKNFSLPQGCKRDLQSPSDSVLNNHSSETIPQKTSKIDPITSKIQPLSKLPSNTEAELLPTKINNNNETDSVKKNFENSSLKQSTRITITIFILMILVLVINFIKLITLEREITNT